MHIIPWGKEKIDEIVRLWNKEIGAQFPMRKDLFVQNSFDDENVLPSGSSIAVDEEGNVIGFIVAKTWQEKIQVNMNKECGWIQVLLVDSDFRNQGIGVALLKRAEKAFYDLDLKIIKVGTDPWHYFPGVPEQYPNLMSWFERRGYHHEGNEFDLLCEYHEQQQEYTSNDENVTFSLLKESEKEQLLSFLNRCFPGRWEYEAIKYFEKGGTGREFVVLKKNKQIIGFCRINDDLSPFIAQNVYWSPLFNDVLGGVGPLGVDQEQRKQGYGLAIVEAGIAHLRERGINKIVIDWTGLVDFYGKLGYKPWKTYLKYTQKQLEVRIENEIKSPWIFTKRNRTKPYTRCGHSYFLSR